MTQNPIFNPGLTPEAQWQAAQSAANPTPHPGAGDASNSGAGAPPQSVPGPTAHPEGGPAPVPHAEAAAAAPAAQGTGKAGGRPSNLVLAGAGSLLAVLAFLGGMAVGHSWDGTSNQQNQFGGPGDGGFGRFPGQGNGQGQGSTGQGQGSTGQGQGSTGQG